MGISLAGAEPAGTDRASAGARRLPDGQPDHRYRHRRAPVNLAAVLDWELTHTGQAVEDLAWFCIRAWRFGAPRELSAGGLGSIENFLAADEAAGGAAVDRTALHWWLVLETLRWGVICRYQTHRHLSGQTRSAELDLLNLLEGV